MSYVNLRQEAQHRNSFAQSFEPPRVVPNHSYAPVSNSSVAREFANNFDYFQSSDSGFVTRQTLEQAANRPMTRNPFDDRMTLLASEILNRPELSHLLDAINHNGQEDGLVSHGDVSSVVDYYEAQEAPPVRGMPGRYDGAMQRYRVDNDFSMQPAAYGGRPYQEAPNARANPSNGPMPDARFYGNDSKEDFSNKVLARFSALEDPNEPGFITDKSLSAVASGSRLDGQPATQAEMAIANELLERGGLFKELDQGSGSVLDGRFSRADLGEASSTYRNMSDHSLLQGIKDNYRQFTAGANDEYVNFNELKEAAGIVSSQRTFSPEARQLAAEILKRPGLLRELDIGIKENGKPGAEDLRFNIVNVDYMLDKKPAAFG